MHVWPVSGPSRPDPSPPAAGPVQPSGRPASSGADWTGRRSSPGNPPPLQRDAGQRSEVRGQHDSRVRTRLDT